MDPKHNAGAMLCAPHTQGVVDSSPQMRSPQMAGRTERGASFPPVDQHVVKPEVTYDEMIRGRKVSAMTALFPHAKAQNGLAFLIAPHVKPGYVALTELLTRAAEDSDFGTDVCVCREGTDPETGSRYLEEISFEVVNEQTMRDVREKAEDLIRRGVRRVFAIFVKKSQACEWSKATNAFVTLDNADVLEDELFVRPIAVKALLDYRLSENEVARALDLKGNPAIESLKENARKLGVDEGRKLGVDEGLLHGRRETLVELVNDRFGDIPTDIEARIRTAGLAQLRQWSKMLLTAGSLNDVFTGN